jgi:hypothetical protein
MAREANEDDAVIAYKTILSDIIDNRPSGTRQRLATALGKHRSFVTQVTSPAYATPLPARHLETIFRVCHFSPVEQQRFLEAFQRAHPGKLPDVRGGDKVRQLTLTVPDLGDDKKNRKFDEAVGEFIQRIASLTLEEE